MPISTISQKGLDTPIALTTPNLGTPSAINLSNAVALPKVALPSGSVLQVVSTTLTTSVTISGTAFQTISGLTATITPLSTSSKIYIRVDITAGAIDTNVYAACRIQRNGSDLTGAISTIGGNPVNATWAPFPAYGGQNTGAQYDLFSSGATFLDSPSSTSSLTYSITASPMRTSNNTMYINQSGNTGDSNRRNGISTITLMEIAG